MSEDKSCLHHKQQLTYFCETCSEPVCNDCMVHGPHQTKVHIHTKLAEAYHNRRQYIKQRIEGTLRTKKDALVDHLDAIDVRMCQIHDQRVVLENDISMEFEGGIIKRLNDSKGGKLAVLQKDIAGLQRHINEIDDFVQGFEHLAHQESNVLPLLFMSKSLSKEMNRLLQLVLKVQINVTPYDMPRELMAMREELANAPTLQDQIHFKKSVAWKSRQEKLAHTARQKGDFFEMMEGEISEWVGLLKRVVGAFDTLCLVCAYCGCFLASDIVNEDCQANKKPHQEAKIDFKSLTEVEPKVKHFGTYKHFYGEPKVDTRILKKDQYPNFGDYQEQKLAAKEIYLKTFRTLWFSVIDLKARKYLKQYDLEAIFAKYDKDNTGWLTIIKFKYLLHKELEMNVTEVESLVNFFKDDKQDKINYAYFLNIDWYINELQHLEEKLAQESHKHKRLYPKRSALKKATTPEKIINKSYVDVRSTSQQQAPANHSYGIRFTQPDRSKIVPTVTYPKLDYGFGFQDRPQSVHVVVEEPDQKASSLKLQPSASVKSILKSSSLNPSRFQVSQASSDSFLHKYYQQ